MLSARELALEQNPAAVGFVNQRIIYTHGIGAAMVPVNEVANEGQPRLFIRNLPPVSSDGAPEITAAPDLLRRAAERLRHHRRAPVGVRHPDRRQRRRERGRHEDALDRRYRHLASATRSCASCSRLRFRDLDLFISDQVTAESQLLMHRSLADRIPRIAPFLAYDKDPYLVIDGSGRLLYVQDAYTMSDRFPHAQSFDPRGFETTGLGDDPINYIRNSVKITMDAYDGTMTFYVADDADPLIRAWAGHLPDPVPSRSTSSRRT